MAGVDTYRVSGARKIARAVLPGGVRAYLQAGINAVHEATFKLHGTPPRSVRLAISPVWFDFKKAGRDQLEFLTELAGIRPSDKVLDIACGVGRLAIPLTRFLNEDGRYEGFDADPSGIAWCKKNIGSRNKKFHFTAADVRTALSPGASQTAEDFVFPYGNSYFDIVYAGSIFTHLRPDAARNYLKQTKRVLKPGGRLVATWNVYNKKYEGLNGRQTAVAKHWQFDHGNHKFKSEEFPEENIAYDVDFLRELYSEAELTVIEPFRGDASYCPARIPADRAVGMHLYHTSSVIAVL